MLKSLPHSSEEYYCINCSDFKKQNEVDPDWNCIVCNNSVEIRIVTKSKDQNCHRISATEIEIDDKVLMHRDEKSMRVLGKTDLGIMVQLNLEGYGAWKVKKDEGILKINGRWNF
ncbi:hypothetical protein [Flavobacterium sp. ov086]|uniref:hypothetical protein n=1 Tax=Flavobacterium sp. ov086 TaxID=1761785 RepID=UPI000B62D535|nr:hypothetical protein [Flavobacterium sp. ov086]SNR71904.1 hypothetical protein SAMN04487979_11827 [Flavobacterium sp. ov086]